MSDLREQLVNEWLDSKDDGLTEYVIKYLKRSKRYRILEIWEFEEMSLGRRIKRGKAIQLFMEEKRKLSEDPNIKDVELVEVRTIAK